MIRKCLALLFCMGILTAVTGCPPQRETTITEKKEIQTESTPQDVSPGTMIVE